MSILSSSSSFLKYKIKEDLQANSSTLSIDQIRTSLKKNRFPDIINSETSEMTAGWTTLESPFDPDFETDPLTYGKYIIFSLRMDKKVIPKKIVEKELAIETKKILKEGQRDFISKKEKSTIKEDIILKLSLIIPSTPDIYNVVWIPETGEILFFSLSKAVNEVFENLFRTSFSKPVIRIFPYTKIFFSKNVKDADKDKFYNIKPYTLQD